MIGDVRDYASVVRAARDADIVFAAAALKQVPSCEYFPWEACRTNIEGAENLVRAISEFDLPIETVMGISTDKACKPVNVMGMTKAIQERVYINGNVRAPKTRFICARYGNVLASRGSVVPLFLDQIAAGGPVTITTADMTRFLLTLDDAVDTIFAAVRSAAPGETYIPECPSAEDDRPGRLPHRRPRHRDDDHRHPPRREDPRDPALRGGGHAHDRRPRGLLRAAARCCPSSPDRSTSPRSSATTAPRTRS